MILCRSRQLAEKWRRISYRCHHAHTHAANQCPQVVAAMCDDPDCAGASHTPYRALVCLCSLVARHIFPLFLLQYILSLHCVKLWFTCTTSFCFIIRYEEKIRLFTSAWFRSHQSSSPIHHLRFSCLNAQHRRRKRRVLGV